MNWNEHSSVKDLHAFLSPSKISWIRYDSEKLRTAYMNFLGVERGTRLHAYASEAIQLKRKQPKTKDTVSMFINDAIGYKMQSEQPLFYSYNCFGTADAISFRKNLLRIHDLKTGNLPAHMEQLMIYAALFCLEYDHNPEDIGIELRIYQFDDIQVCNPKPEEIRSIMEIIESHDEVLNKLKEDM